MTTEEKQLLTQLLEKSKVVTDKVDLELALSKEELSSEMVKSIDLLKWLAEIAKRKDTPGIVSKWLGRLWRKIRIAISEWVSDIACEIHPDCKLDDGNG